ncbi:hypothetical protein COY51_00155 [Candidatus Desantisbacteria bacterium CG_4_10_14_0_8_um_filter_39_17]|uniref:Metallo-beta-lactamase domain-containing protein n=1 Tax=Candidatus Desantisbacteria bacterium CG_4_10_14_0_8_um_filter_39_17 TaxID=1974542 RepID=A0A2H9PDA2_9BACT|nr:MAG: hypothetical protein COY51_00155 [Candidatus Desantisbacteria bacterium CG_4_10_14_0_8_um_filter_39_17]
MTVKTVVVGELETNCYIIGDKENYAIIDPGADAKKIMMKMVKMVSGTSQSQTPFSKPVPIILTHAHPDHLGAAGEITGELKGQIYLHSLDSEWLKHIFGSSFPGLRNVEDNEIIKVGSIELRVIYTPGHTQGSICLYLEREGTLFSGDTLFAAGVGRTDLPGGDEESLRSSLKRLWTLPDSVKVYPGHGPQTTIKNEKGATGEIDGN